MKGGREGRCRGVVREYEGRRGDGRRREKSR